MAGDDSAFDTRPSLLVRIRDARDQEAWSTFLEIYAPVAYRYCRRRGLQDGDAADVTQEVMAQVARSAQRFEYRSERGRFRDWMGVIARNKVADHLRSARKSASAAGESQADLDEIATVGADPDWGEEFDAQVYRAALGRVRERFESASWRAFELVWVENCPAAEVAATLGVPVDAVYVAKSRVLKRLREEIIAIADDLPLYTPLG
jgi:RNA polymerase sigma factor (sigma-70 family)